MDSDDNLIAVDGPFRIPKQNDLTSEMEAFAFLSTIEVMEFGHFFVRMLVNGEYPMERRLFIVEGPEDL